ncbi:MAG TPA: PAS domain-containing protein [Stellaceae bacterium]|jgi:hypothetical protein|nr:PAS domain-containing protein [Stellaceae bacterium]
MDEGLDGPARSAHGCPALREEPLLAAFVAYWERKRGARDVPEKRDIDPAEIDPALLPFVAVGELDVAGRVRYRLVGTGITTRHGIDPTGKYVDEVLNGTYGDYIRALIGESMRKRRPVYSDAISRYDAGPYLRVKRVILPLTGGGGDIRFIIGAQLIQSPPEQDDAQMRWYRGNGALHEIVRVVF